MSKIDEIKKRHKDRRHQLINSSGRTSHYFENDLPYKGLQDKSLSTKSPLLRSQAFIIKCMLSVVLVLGAAIFFKAYASTFPKVEKVIEYAMNEDVNFAKISNWYEKNFGEPLAILPSEDQAAKKTSTNDNEHFAVPVSGGVVTKGFSDTKKGVFVQTDVDAKVDAIESGFVVSVGIKDGIGKTVVIRHSNGAESWYGNLETVNVKPYDFVKREQNIGTVTTAKGEKIGTFYFALKEGDHFVDPIQVISFE